MDDFTKRYIGNLLCGLPLSEKECIREDDAIEFYDMCKEYFDWYKTVDPKAKMDHKFMHRILWCHGIRTKDDLKYADVDYIATIKGLCSRGKKFALVMTMKLSLE
jgi:hypothetical protein